MISIILSIWLSTQVNDCSLPDLNSIQYESKVYRENYTNRILEQATYKYKGIYYQLTFELDGELLECRQGTDKTNLHAYSGCARLRALSRKLNKGYYTGYVTRPTYCQITN